ncbi:MAG: ATP-binding cassette domain-containing protein, partial [Leptothrix sp. (in: b-proteobacteria)]
PVAAAAREPGDAALEAPAALLSVLGLNVAYPVAGPARWGGWWRAPRSRAVVMDVNLQLAAGRTLALVGESGSGKTSTGQAIAQLLRRRAVCHGEARLNGRDLFALNGEALRQARREVQLVFQDPLASLNPRLRIAEILAEGLRELRPEWDGAERARRLRELLDQVGLPASVLGAYPHAFSGGQRQRIAIARALAVEPQLLICDEPTSALDVSVQAQILNLLRTLQRERGLALLFITHHIGVVEYLADTVAVMQGGRIVEAGSVDRVLGAPQQAFTRELLAAVPRLAPRPA